MDSVLPSSSLRLLVPPLRVMLAVMWKSVRQRNIKHYGKVEEFVSLVAEAVPDIMTDREMRLLTLGLRAKITLLTLHSGELDDLGHVKTLLDKLLLNSSKQLQPEIEGLEENFVKLVQSLLDDTTRREDFLKNVYPDEYGSTFDTALETMLCDFFGRLEELLFIPNFKQTAVWISDSPSVLEEYMHCLTKADDFKELLKNKEHHGNVSIIESKELSPSEEELFFSLSLPASLKTTKEVESTTQINRIQFESEWISPLEVEDTIVEDERLPDENEMQQSNVEQTTVETCTVTVSNTHVEGEDNDGAPSLSTNSRVVSMSLSTTPPQRVAQKCGHCGKCFIYRYELQQHQRLHTGESPYDCTQCGKAFRTTSDLSTHRRTRCADALYICIKCGLGFQSKQEKYRHECAGIERFECSQCGRVFKKMSMLTKHELVHSQGAAYTCRQCKAIFPSINELKSHQKDHPKSNLCMQCGKVFGTAKNLAAHELRHTKEKKVICAHCGKAFKYKGDLKVHMRTHTGERPFQCPHCEKRFSMPGNLTIHIRTHTGEKPYQCSDCGKAFSSAGDLQIHRRTHTGEKPYRCTVCEKRFIQKSKLQLHMRVHTGERPYVCLECGRRFSRGSELNKHTMTHTGAQPFTCLVCEKKYRCINHLKRHLKTHNEVQT